jgi:hypothetical protein
MMKLHIKNEKTQTQKHGFGRPFNLGFLKSSGFRVQVNRVANPTCALHALLHPRFRFPKKPDDTCVIIGQKAAKDPATVGKHAETIDVYTNVPPALLRICLYTIFLWSW